MTSQSPIERLFAAYLLARGFEPQTMPMAHARYLYDAIREGVTPEMLSDVVKDRMKRPYATQSMKEYCLRLSHLIGNDERIADLIDEANAIKAKRRKPMFTQAKQEVLRATHRPDEPEAQRVRRVDEIQAAVFEEMRKQTN